MPSCPQCGKTYAADVRTCPQDGTTLSVDVDAELPPPLPAQPAAGRPGRQPSVPPLQVPQGMAPAVRQSAPLRPDLDALAEVAAELQQDLETTSDAEATAALYTGKLIADKYQVGELIGRGGMGAVFACEQIHLKKVMAIKLLHENLVTRKQLISRFTREARAISRLTSPHTVGIYDFGRQGELFYLVMELLRGEPLDEVLQREGRLPVPRAVGIALQMCDSLAEAHEHGVIHRDLKPENVMLVEHGGQRDFVKILDFGLAKVQGADDPYTIHSQREIFGTPFYMSPEQVRATVDIDGRADIYALGALLAKVLTGQYLFARSSTFDVLKGHLMEAPPSLGQLAPDLAFPPGLEAIVARCLQKDPAERFATMAELQEALRTGLESGFDAPAKSAAPLPGTGRAALAPESAASQRHSADLVDAEQVLEATRRRDHLRLGAFVLLSLLLLGVALAVLLPDGKGVREEEREPNDSPLTAGPMPASGKVTGMIGKRISAQKADQDCFTLPPLPQGHELRLRVQGVPNMDLQLSLHSAEGIARLTSNHAGRGQGEWLRFPGTRGDWASVCVTEFLPVGAVAGESLSDRYTLTADSLPRPAFAESEPNDEAGGNALASGVEIQGFLDGPRDQDRFGLAGLFDGRMLRAQLTLQTPSPDPGPVRLTLLDSGGRMIAAEVVRPGQTMATLAFVATPLQAPDRLVVQRLPADGADPEPLGYALQYRLAELAEQPETEPNDDAKTAPALVLGALHTGQVGDAGGDDWLRVDGGDANLRRIRLEVEAPDQPWLLTVRDAGTQVDLRTLAVTSGLAERELSVVGSGSGFLLRVQPASASRKTVAGWKIRARYLSSTDGAVQLGQ